MAGTSEDDGGTARGQRPRAARSAATLAAVADRVGVSRTTVSNAYNRPDQLSADLRNRILTAANELGYAGPDPVARSLRTRQADAVGLIFTERLGYAFRDPGAVEFLHGLAEACNEQRRSLLMITTNTSDNDERVYSTEIVSRASVDGFVVYSMPSGNPYLEAVLRRPEPIVIVDAPHSMPDLDFVGIDDRTAFAAVASHVLQQGHQRVGVVTVRRGEELSASGTPMPLMQSLSTGQSPHPVRQQRLLGLFDAVQLHAITREQVVVSERSNNSRDEGAAGAAALLLADPGTTAVLCTSDILAFGVLDELARRGLRAGIDVAVTGFDDVPAAAAANLTTVRQPMEAKGRAAVEALLDGRPRVRGHRVLLPTELIIRSSSG